MGELIWMKKKRTPGSNPPLPVLASRSALAMDAIVLEDVRLIIQNGPCSRATRCALAGFESPGYGLHQNIV